MTRQREILLEFRTPQHPSIGSNYWGGASPLLARNIPKESLEQRYVRLNAIRIRDEVFPAAATAEEVRCTDRRKRRWWFFAKLARKKEEVGLGNISRWRLPRWDPKHRWPQGW